jgi:hypothetical protein
MYSYFPTEEDNEDLPFCDDCGQPMEADADVDIDEDTRRPYVSGWTARCTNRNCPEPPDA